MGIIGVLADLTGDDDSHRSVHRGNMYEGNEAVSAAFQRISKNSTGCSDAEAKIEVSINNFGIIIILVCIALAVALLSGTQLYHLLARNYKLNRSSIVCRLRADLIQSCAHHTRSRCLPQSMPWTQTSTQPGMRTPC